MIVMIGHLSAAWSWRPASTTSSTAGCSSGWSCSSCSGSAAAGARTISAGRRRRRRSAVRRDTAARRPARPQVAAAMRAGRRRLPRVLAGCTPASTLRANPVDTPASLAELAAGLACRPAVHRLDAALNKAGAPPQPGAGAGRPAGRTDRCVYYRNQTQGARPDQLHQPAGRRHERRLARRPARRARIETDRRPRRCRCARPGCAARTARCWSGTGTGSTAASPPTTIVGKLRQAKRSCCSAATTAPARACLRRTTKTREAARAALRAFLAAATAARLETRAGMNRQRTEGAMTRCNAAPLVVHLIYRFDFGGLETLLVECINRMPAAPVPACGGLPDRLYRVSHSKISRDRRRAVCAGQAARTRAGHPPELWKLLRRLKPACCTPITWPRSSMRAPPRWPACRCGCTPSTAATPATRMASNRKHNLLRRADARSSTATSRFATTCSAGCARWSACRTRRP